MNNQNIYEPYEPTIYINFVKLSIRMHTSNSGKHTLLFSCPEVNCDMKTLKGKFQK